MSWRAWFLAALCAALITDARAQETTASLQNFAVQARAEGLGCERACAVEARTCHLAGRHEPSFCDTGLIRCTLQCQDCVSAYARCSFAAKNAAEPRCTQELDICRPRETSAADARHPLITFDGGDGSSIDGAIVIKGARNTREGLQAQTLWVGKAYFGWRRHGHARVVKDDHHVYDQVEYMTPRGEQKTVFFEVSDFSEKF